MDRNEVFQHYSEILDDLIDNSEFFQIYFQSCYTLEDDMELKNYLKLCTGVSRGCLIDSRYDYVVKFNLNQYSACDREISIYEDAIHYKVDKFFAEPIYIGTYKKSFKSYKLCDVLDTIDTWYNEDDFNQKLPRIEAECEKCPIFVSIDLFAYPRVDFSETLFSFYTKEDEDYAKESVSPLKEFNLAIAAAFIADYGTEEYNRLTDFLYDWDINDIHLGNVGEFHNRIVIIDYAGV